MFLKIIASLVILIVKVSIIFSQQLPFSNQYLVNRQFLSPAYSGYTDNFEIFMSYQKNALHFPGGPEYKSIYASGPVFENMSLGLSVSKSSVTIFNLFSSQVNYAYHLRVSDKQYIHFGLSVEYIENYLNLANQNISVISDPYLLDYGYTFDVGFGLVYSYKTFQLGFVVPRSNESRIRNRDTRNAAITIQNLFRVHASCLLNINRQFSLEPFVVIDQSALNPLWYNVSTILRYKEITWLEAHYNSGDMMGFGFGFSPTKKMLINFSHEFSSSGLMKYSDGIHEISIGFLLGTVSDRKYQKSAFRSPQKQPYYEWIK